jgi:hypothetical protein
MLNASLRRGIVNGADEPPSRPLGRHVQQRRRFHLESGMRVPGLIEAN